MVEDTKVTKNHKGTRRLPEWGNRRFRRTQRSQRRQRGIEAGNVLAHAGRSRGGLEVWRLGFSTKTRRSARAWALHRSALRASLPCPSLALLWLLKSAQWQRAKFSTPTERPCGATGEVPGERDTARNGGRRARSAAEPQSDRWSPKRFAPHSVFAVR